MDLSNPQAFRKQIAEAHKTLSTLWRIRRTVDQRMDDLRTLIRANANFLPEQERSAELLALELLRLPTTIAEAIKHALYVAAMRNERLTLQQLKELAEERGFDFSTYTNPVGSIYTILKRMKDADPPEVDFDEAAGTYLSARKIPKELANPQFSVRMNVQAWLRMANENPTRADQIAEEEVGSFLDSVVARQHKEF